MVRTAVTVVMVTVVVVAAVVVVVVALLHEFTKEDMELVEGSCPHSPSPTHYLRERERERGMGGGGAGGGGGGADGRTDWLTDWQRKKKRWKKNKTLSHKRPSKSLTTVRLHRYHRMIHHTIPLMTSWSGHLKIHSFARNKSWLHTIR